MSSLTQLNLESFNDLKTKSDNVYLLDFWAEWCGPCKAMNPILERLSVDADLVKSQINIAKINIDEVGELAQEFEITGIPTMVMVKFNSKTGVYDKIQEFVGLQSDPLKLKMNILDSYKKISDNSGSESEVDFNLI
jgi:thioredoxin 1